MKNTILIAAIAALVLVSAMAEARCIRGSDTVNCFGEPFVVLAHPDVDVARYVALTQLSDFQRQYTYILTTNDQTRRALVVYPNADSTPQTTNGDQYVSELFFTNGSQSEVDLFVQRYASLNADQRAGSFTLPVARDFLGGGTLLVYRTFTQFKPVFAPITEATNAR